MPNLGPGVDQVLSPAVSPTWAFTPNPSAAGTGAVRFYNNGNVPIYIGTAQVTQNTGLPINPGNKVELWNVTKTFYAVSGAQATSTGSATIATVAAGNTVITIGGVSGNIAPGSTVIVGNASGQEALTVTGTLATALTLSTATLFDHVQGVTVTTATPSLGLLRVSA